MRKEITHNKLMFKIIGLTVAVCLFVWFALDIIIAFSHKELPARPESDEGSSLVHQLLHYFENPLARLEDGVVINEEYIINAITPAKKYIDGRYDCMDFRMQSLMRLQYLYGEEIRFISPEASQMIKDAFLNAKYWMNEPGKDSLCFWSENHQILYAVSEYLAGYMWQDEIFTNDNSTGLERMERGRRRIEYWMKHRFYYGFSEFNSNNYYHFNIGPASNFIQFASPDDQDLVNRMKICLDLLFYDLATNMHHYVFSAPSGRAYASNMPGITGDRVRPFTDFVWGLTDDYKSTTHHMLINFVSMSLARDKDNKPYYEVPEVIKEIGRDNSTKVIKSSSGLNVSELKDKGYIGHGDEQMMAQLGMEAFTNPEVIHNTLTYFSKYNMFSNSFVNDFKYINLSLLKSLNLVKPISKYLNPMPNGIAIQRANIYTYKTDNYKLATAQAYHPGSYGAQQFLSVANLSPQAVVFTTHPARYESAKSVNAVPGYWAGFGRAPHSVQHLNIQLSVYQLPEKSGFLELYDVPQFTHTYFPKAFFDEVIIIGRYAFGRVGNAYIGLIGATDLEYLPYSEMSALTLRNGLENFGLEFDLIQRGLNQFWIYELSDAGVESFEEFMSRIQLNTVAYNGIDSLSYNSGGVELSVKFKGNFTIDGVVQDLEYKRFESEYIVADRESDEFVFFYKGRTLTINYPENTRVYD